MAATKNELAIPETIFRDFRVATMCTGEPAPAAYGAINDVAIGVAKGIIQWIVPTGEVPDFEAARTVVEIVRGENRWMTPGLIDCHTHLVHGGNRANEWEMRLSGRSYQEIARAGGGILSTVKATRAASENELVASAEKRLSYLLAEGVTTIEIKSGYGLDVETELKMLGAARRLGETTYVDVQTTLLGAHAVAPEFAGRSDAYIDLVCEEMIPAAHEICTAVDAFCESIAFDVEQTKKVLAAAIDADLKIKVHAEQLSNMGMAAEAARMGAISADHLEFLSPADCSVLAEHGTVATLLPGAFYCLQETQKPPVAALLANEVPIAIATDCNPGSSPAVSLLLMGNMACNLLGLTPEQALAGMTVHAARALGLSDRGKIQAGAQADFAIWDVESPAEILYSIGGNACVSVFKNGKKVLG